MTGKDDNGNDSAKDNGNDSAKDTADAAINRAGADKGSPAREPDKGAPLSDQQQIAEAAIDRATKNADKNADNDGGNDTPPAGNW